MDTSQKIRNSWLNFGLSYLEIADLACQEMQKDNPSKGMPDLYIATVYNVKHGIEVLLKSIIVSLEDQELIKKDEIHNQEALFSKIRSVINLPNVKKVIAELIKNEKNDEYLAFISEKTENLENQFNSIGDLVYKYQRLDFFKNKIGNDFVIEDIDNTTFKYPRNSLNIKLDYAKILKRLTKEDAIDLNADIKKLISIFVGLYLVLSEYSYTKKTKN